MLFLVVLILVVVVLIQLERLEELDEPLLTARQRIHQAWDDVGKDINNANLLLEAEMIRKNPYKGCLFSPSVNTNKVLRPAEHEVWLSFPSDSGATTFYEWWYQEGEALWIKYHEKNKENYE